MNNKSIKKLITDTLNFEIQPNLNIVTVIFSQLFKSGFQINYYFDYGSIQEENQESISRIETLIYSSLPSSEVTGFEIRSAMYQNSYELIEGEEIIYSRGKLN